MPTSSNTSQIAKNTLLLYFRMIFLMMISLYTSRVILATLGVNDFGIYNVVGGIVGMLSFLSSSMANAAQRFLSYELGKNEKTKVNDIFCLCVIAHCIIALFVVVVIECIGPWFMQNKMTIPEERINAANWVLQFSILTTFFTIMQVPYNAIIISKEQMNVYAYVSIIEGILRLLIVYMLVVGSFDKLKLYAVLQFSVTILMCILYRIYCVRKFEEAKFRFVWNKKTLKEITSFAGWNMLGEIAWTFTGQGVNIILNIFCGPAVNAARAIAEQVNNAVSKFVSNFQTALNPQIVKTYAAKQWDETIKLVYRGTKFSFFLLLMLSMPIIMETDFVLNLWLENVPDYTSSFCKFVLITSLVAMVTNYLAQIAKAYGKIRNYQLIVSFILTLNFPLSYIVLKFGASPVWTMYVAVFVQAVLIVVRMILVKKMITINFNVFFREICKPLIIVSLTAAIVPYLLLNYLESGWMRFVVNCFVSVICVILSSYFLGMKSEEKYFIKNIPLKILNKFYKK